MKRKIHIITFILLASIAISPSTEALYAQYYQRADFGDISVTRKNQLGGYDYYNKSGNKVGYSKKAYSGDYLYYDNAGNKLGTLKQDKEEDTYTFYGADNIATGSLRKTPMGEYRYRSKLEGGLRGITPPPGEGIGFIPPSTFLEGTYSSQLEGGFQEEQE